MTVDDVIEAVGNRLGQALTSISTWVEIDVAGKTGVVLLGNAVVDGHVEGTEETVTRSSVEIGLTFQTIVAVGKVSNAVEHILGIASVVAGEETNLTLET